VTDYPEPQTIQRTADADQGSWVYRYAPDRLRPYLKLARMDRPVGTWLLLWPCLWSLIMATQDIGAVTLWYGGLFGVGALVMRSAGCAYNDIVDRDIDARVTRTASRPIPAGEMTTRAAFGSVIALSLVGLAVLLQFNAFTIAVGAGSLLLVAAYPFMKRITWWPQAWLGLTFNWGALVGAAAVTGGLPDYALVLYAGCVFWTLGYDTIYAHQDREDDALIGIGSTALRLGNRTRPALILFYAVFAAALFWAGMLAKLGVVYYTGAALTTLHLVWQIWRVDIHDPARCLAVFKSNIGMGGVIAAALIAERLLNL